MSIRSFEFEVERSPRYVSCGLTIEIPGDGGRPGIVCSQKRDYSGTSITNALELIAYRLYHQVALRKLALGKKDLKPIEEGLSRYWKEKIGSNRKPSGLHELYGKKGVQWIEHYPPGTSFGTADSFREVLFDAQSSPIWQGNYSLGSAKEKFSESLVVAASKFADGA